MRIAFELPPALGQSLRREYPNLHSAAKTAFLVQLFRDGRVLHGQFANAMGLSREEADGVLKQHGVLLDLKPEEIERDVQGLLESLRG